MDSKLINDFKIIMKVLKFTPLLLAFIQFLILLLQIAGVSTLILTLLGFIIPLLFIYLSSFVFKFCIYHRLPLYYIAIVTILCLVDMFIGIPINLFVLAAFHVVLFAILLILILKFRYGSCCIND